MYSIWRRTARSGISRDTNVLKSSPHTLGGCRLTACSVNVSFHVNLVCVGIATIIPCMKKNDRSGLLFVLRTLNSACSVPRPHDPPVMYKRVVSFHEIRRICSRVAFAFCSLVRCSRPFTRSNQDLTIPSDSCLTGKFCGLSMKQWLRVLSFGSSTTRLSMSKYEAWISDKLKIPSRPIISSKRSF